MFNLVSMINLAARGVSEIGSFAARLRALFTPHSGAAE